MRNPYSEMLMLLRQFQADQLARNQSCIDNLPPEVRARIPDDWADFISYGYMLAYADAEKFCRDLVEAEKQRREGIKP